MTLWWFPSKRALWRPTSNPGVNHTVIMAHPDAILLTNPDALSEDVQQAVLMVPAGTLITGLRTHTVDEASL